MFENKKIFIFGMARSGYECAKLLSQYTSHILVTDGKDQDPIHVKELENLGVEVVITNNPEELLDETYDFVVKNPGIIKTHSCILKAKELSIPVINEVEVAYHLLPEDVKIIGITGSNGKTTTTTMIYEVLKQANLPVYLGGNIGYPVCSLVDKVKSGDILVLEISDHQLVDVKDFKTNISILTNLSEVHIDFHGDYETYKQMKKKIFMAHTSSDLAILNLENKDSMELCKDIQSKKEFFSSKQKADACIQDDFILYKNEKIISLDEIKIKGMHNYENIMCMIMAVKEFDVSSEIIQDYLKNFGGVEHRIEYVTEKRGVTFYNDSKATNTDSTIIALDSFTKPTILILGGLDRGHSFDPLKDHLKNTKEMICYGETKHRIKEFADQIGIPCKVVETLKEATKISYEDAKDGDVVLFSPACASWDQYENFEIRGTEFKTSIEELQV